MLQRLELFCARGFGLGLLPIAPGTWGTLAGVVLFIFLVECSYSAYLAITLLLFLLGLRLCAVATQILAVHDDKSVVWDEIVGYLVTMFMVPYSWYWMVLGFFVFRFFDIVKPYPIHLIDSKMHNSFGIMFDDVVAGLYGFVTMQLLIYITTLGQQL